MPKPRVLYWFRTDLRLHDSPALKAALDLKPECLYPVFTWDPHYVKQAKVGPNRWQILLDSLSALSHSITQVNPSSKLLLIRESPLSLIPKLLKEWRISHLVFEKDTDAYARDRDAEVSRLAEAAGVEVLVKVGRTLYDPDQLVKKNGGKPTMSMAQVMKASKSLPSIPRPIPAPTSLPSPGDTTISFSQTQPHTSKDEPVPTYSSLLGPKNDFAVPTLAELELPPATTPHRGGEERALTQLSAILADKSYVANFSKPETAPTAFEPASTTVLSAHLHFGSLGVRKLWWGVVDTIAEHKAEKKDGNGKEKAKSHDKDGGNHSTTASSTPQIQVTSLQGQLLFREMYFGAQAALGHSFTQAVGDPVCRFIPWHLPSVTDAKTYEHVVVQGSDGTVTRDGYIHDSSLHDAYLHRWAHGLTGYPFIDALMRQLRHEGWIHHLGRHAVSCFLTRGGCYVHWERGAEVFEELLIDHEPACNIGNWMWVSCAGFFDQYYRCYSPIAFGKRWDPEGEFVKRWVPELKGFGKKFVYEPWKASDGEQRSWGCLIKGDGSETKAGEGEGGLMVYPEPMLDFDEEKKKCMARMKEAYGVGIYGTDKRVLDGSWRDLFTNDYEQGGGSSNDEHHDHRKRKPSDDASINKHAPKRSKGQTTLDAFTKKPKP